MFDSVSVKQPQVKSSNREAFIASSEVNVDNKATNVKLPHKSQKLRENKFRQNPRRVIFGPPVRDNTENSENYCSSSGESLGENSEDKMNARLANLCGLVWDEFYLCNPSQSPTVAGEVARQACHCGQCFNSDGPISHSSKSQMIPQHIVFFCQQLQKECVKKFNSEAETQVVVAEYLMDKWLL